MLIPSKQAPDLVHKVQATALPNQPKDGGIPAPSRGKFYLQQISANDTYEFNTQTMAATLIKGWANHQAYMLGADKENDLIVGYKRWPSGQEGFRTINRDGSGEASLGFKDDSVPAITEQFSQCIILNGQIFWANNSWQLRRADYPAGTNQTTLSTVPRYYDLDYNPLDGFIYTAVWEFGLRRFKPDGTGFETLVSGSGSARYLRCRVDGWNGYLFTIESDDQVRRWDLSNFGAGGTLIGTASGSEFILEIDPDKQAVYWLGGNAPDRLYEYDYDGNLLRTSSSNLNLCRSSTYFDQ